MKPVGVFDSGFGGVSFLKKAVELMPEGIIYIMEITPMPHTEIDLNMRSTACR